MRRHLSSWEYSELRARAGHDKMLQGKQGAGGFMNARPRVVVADDHRVMLDILVRALSAEFEVVAAVADGPSAVQAAGCFAPDLLVLDIAMPGLNGIAVGDRVKQSGSAAKIVFITTFTDQALLRQALTLGDIGFVAKNHLAADLMPAIRSVLAGQSFVSPSLPR